MKVSTQVNQVLQTVQVDFSNVSSSIERLVNGVAVRRLRIPNRFSSLPKVREAVLKDLGALDLGPTFDQR